MVLGSKFFRMVRVHQAAPSAGRDFENGPLPPPLPRIVILSRDGEVAASLEGNIPSKALFKTMKTLVSVEYGKDLDEFVSKMRKILDRMDNLASKRLEIQCRRALAREKGWVRVLEKLKEEERILDGKEAALHARAMALLSWTRTPLPSRAKEKKEERVSKKL